MKPEEYMHAFSIIHRYSVMLHIKETATFEISGHQMGYIIHIHKHPGISQEDLASFFKLNKGTVAKGIKRLLEAGYITKKQNEEDRRAYRLFLTEAGQAVLEEANSALDKFNHILTKDMSDSEQKIFQELISRACGNIIDAAGEDKEELMRPGPPPEMEENCCKGF